MHACMHNHVCADVYIHKKSLMAITAENCFCCKLSAVLTLVAASTACLNVVIILLVLPELVVDIL